MYYDLLIKISSDNWHSYGRIDTYSQALHIAKEESKNHLTFVYVRRVDSFGADSWKYFLLNTRTYSKLHSVDSSENTFLCSKFKEIIRSKICLVANQKNQLI